jgi:hypothetical protein
MGFGRRNNGNNGYRKKSKLKLQIRLLGVLLLIMGFLVSISAIQNHNQNIGTLAIVLALIGMVMILQKKGLIRFGKNLTAPPPCNCCKCTNCGIRHNHWTHD